jgi:hypothetical protein
VCSPQHVSIMVARLPSFKRRIVSLTIRERFTPPIACSIRMRMDEMARLAAFSGGVSSPPGGVVLGWTIVIPSPVEPWNPRS